MVNWRWLALPLALSAAPAMGADWTTAGGDLFVSAAAQEPAGASSDERDPARLAPLSQPFGALVAAASERHGLDPKLLHAVVLAESGYETRAVSPAGAAGLMQLMPGTARELGVADRFDPASSLMGGADYLARQLVRFGDVRLALAAYNAGPERVARRGRVPDIAETRAYVDAVVECYLALSAGRGARSSRECRPGRRGHDGT